MAFYHVFLLLYLLLVSFDKISIVEISIYGRGQKLLKPITIICRIICLHWEALIPEKYDSKRVENEVLINNWREKSFTGCKIRGFSHNSDR